MRKTEDSLIQLLMELKAIARRKAEEEFAESLAVAREQGKYPWEGQWVSLEDIEKLRALISRRDRIILSEIIVLFFMVFVCSLLLFSILLAFFLPDST